jgi:polar amino acid transport system substrate-binding protein
MDRDWRRDFRFAYLIEPPFCYRTADGAVAGCDVEVARYVSQVLGVASFTPVETAFAELLPGLADGRWDMTTGLFVTAERRWIAAFSRPIWALGDGLLVPAGNPAQVHGYRSLAASKLRLAVVAGQVQEETARALGVPDDRIRRFTTYPEAARAVVDGEADAYASVAAAHRGYLRERPDPLLSVVEIAEAEKAAEIGAFAFARSATALRDKVDEELGRFLGSPGHIALMAGYGFSAAEVERIAPGPAGRS